MKIGKICWIKLKFGTKSDENWWKSWKIVKKSRSVERSENVEIWWKSGKIMLKPKNVEKVEYLKNMVKKSKNYVIS